MPSILNEIGFFQFDNLIRNRIPFVILNLGVELKGLYKIPLYQNHMENLSISATKATAVAELEKKNLPKHEAVLVVCPTGVDSSQVVDDLEKAGYTNVFFIKNGFESLKTDASH
jgi:rhodanese-related sulfurtransferase